MAVLLTVLGILLIFVLLLLFLPAEAGVRLYWGQQEKKLTVHARIFYIPLSFTIPLEKAEEKSKQKKKKSKETPSEAEKERMTPKRFIALVKSLHRAYQESKQELFALLGFLRKALTCKELTCRIEYGTSNPATTGMLNGAVWTAGTLLLRLLDSAIGVQKMGLHVYPDFTKEFLCLKFCGILKFKPVDLLKIVLKSVKLVNLMKSKIEF